MIENSFYGGHPGFSCVIVKNFPSIEAMKEKFKLGGDYSDVHYNEYVLINTENKNDPDNGRLYRRGYDYTNDLGGAIYVGTIVGPSGQAPHLEMATIEEVKEKQQGEGYDYRYGEGRYSPTVDLVPGKTDDGSFNDDIEWAYCSVRDENGIDTTAYIGFRFPYLVAEFEASSVEAYYNRDSEEANFNNTDLIKRTDNKDHPYYEHWKISVPKGIKGDTFKDFELVDASDGIDYGSHTDQKADDVAYKRKVLVYKYYHYDKDPNGEPVTLYLGDYNMISNITVGDDGTITIDYTHEDTKVYDRLLKWIKSITLDKETGHFVVEYNYAEAPDGKSTKYETDLTWVKNLTVAENGDITLQYSHGADSTLPFHIRWINEIELAADGTVTITYNDGEETVFDKEIKWIDNISLSETGEFNIHYNNGTPDYHVTLKWVTKITITEKGDLTVIYNTGESDEYPKYLKVLDEIIVAKNGDLTITYNTGDSITHEKYLKVLDSITIEDNGDLTVAYNTGESKEYPGYLKALSNITIEDNGDLTINYNTGESVKHPKYLKALDSIDIASNGDLTIAYNTGDVVKHEKYLKVLDNINVASNGDLTITYNTGDIVKHEKYLKVLSDVSIETDTGAGEGSGDQKVHVKYNTGEAVEIGKPLNYIIETVISEDYHYLIYYSDPEKRKQLEQAGKTREYGGKAGWYDLGSIKDEDGILVGLNIDTATHPELANDISAAIKYLNEQYPSGLTGEGLKGKIVTIGGADSNDKKFYAFDYNTKSWYFLGMLKTEMTSLYMIAKASDPDIDKKKNELSLNGLWFVVKE